ncbi:MAG: thermonuclease family protein [Nodosilinea sp.]
MRIANLLLVSALGLSSLTGCSSNNMVERHRFAEQQTEYWMVAQVEDDQTLVLTQGDRTESALLCGIRPPATGETLAQESLDHLKYLLGESAEGEVGVVPVDRDPLGRLVAKVFVPTGGAEEIHVNSQMVLDGMATVGEMVQDCPNGLVMVAAEDRAKEAAVGMWKKAGE